LFVSLILNKPSSNFEQTRQSIHSLNHEILRDIIHSDNIVVAEQVVFETVVAVLGDSPPADPELCQQFDELLFGVRYPLLPNQYILDHVYPHPVLRSLGSEDMRPQISNLLCKCLIWMANKDLDRSLIAKLQLPIEQTKHRAMITSYNQLELGMRVRIITDLVALRTACDEVAPGGHEEVGWVTQMSDTAGQRGVIRELCDDLCSAEVEFDKACLRNDDADSLWAFPFNVLLKAL
jgi:hypothetical protein